MERLANSKKIIGTKQTLKAIEKGTVKLVYLAKDAEAKITEPMRNLCIQKGIAVYEAESMKELGKASGIDVGAATVALIEE